MQVCLDILLLESCFGQLFGMGSISIPEINILPVRKNDCDLPWKFFPTSCLGYYLMLLMSCFDALLVNLRQPLNSLGSVSWLSDTAICCFSLLYVLLQNKNTCCFWYFLSRSSKIEVFLCSHCNWGANIEILLALCLPVR